MSQAYTPLMAGSDPDMQTGTPLVIVGAGGFGREALGLVRDINAVRPTFDFLGFLDDGDVDLERLGRLGARVLGTSARLADLEASYVIAIASPGSRRSIDRLARAASRRAATLRHPLASIGADVRIGDGSIVAGGVYLTTNIEVGRHSVVNLDCTVGHDAIIGDMVTIHPGVHISGAAVIEDGATLGTGCMVLPGVRVGAGSVVGAGAVVGRDVAPSVTVVGPMARQTLGSPPAPG